MHAVIKSVSNRKGPQVQVIGTVDLEDGVAVPSNRRVARVLQGVQVEGDDRQTLGPDSGDAYVRALPKAVKGTHEVTIVEDEDEPESAD